MNQAQTLPRREDGMPCSRTNLRTFLGGPEAGRGAAMMPSCCQRRVEFNSRRTHFCSLARCSPGAARDMKISGTALTSLTNPHSSVSGTDRPIDVELFIVIRSSSEVWFDRGEAGPADIFLG